MTFARKRIGSAVILQVLLIVAMVSVAYSQVLLPLTNPSGELWRLLPDRLRWLSDGHMPSVEVTLDYPTVLKEPVHPNGPFRFPDPPTHVSPGESWLEFLLPSRTEVVVYQPDFRQRVGLIGTTTLRGLLAIAVLALLLFMVRTLRSGDPFVPANARRIYAIAAIVGIGGPLTDLLGQWGRHGVLEHPRIAPLVVPESYHLSLLPLAIGLAIAVAAEVFRQGIALRADVDGLV